VHKEPRPQVRRPEPSRLGRHSGATSPLRKLHSLVVAEDEGLRVSVAAPLLKRLGDRAGARIPGIAEFSTQSVQYSAEGVYLRCSAITAPGAPPGAIAAGVRAELRHIVSAMLGWALGGVYLELRSAGGGDAMVYDLPG
jgi:hypothetical protein